MVFFVVVVVLVLLFYFYFLMLGIALKGLVHAMHVLHHQDSVILKLDLKKVKWRQAAPVDNALDTKSLT